MAVAGENNIYKNIYKEGGEEMKKFIIIVSFLMLTGCGGLYKSSSTNPTERGLGVVAGAIVTSAIIRAFFNK